MKTIVITGSTRGIGYTLAKALLSRGHSVVISGRNQEGVDKSINKLSGEFQADRIFGTACDVRNIKDLQHLWDESVNRFGSIDIWINNAGISNQQNPVWEIPAEEIQSVIQTNMVGEIFGTKIALSCFLKQGYGAVYNLEGMGAQGKTRVKGLSIYGATKSGLRYFNDAVPEEIDNPKVILGALQPGMVLTEMVTGQYEKKPEEWDRVKGILSTISEDVNKVAGWMAEKILNNTKNGVRFHYGGTLRIMIRMIGRVFQKK